ncbi:glycosyl transferase [Vibrio diabolicus]|uniref:glycosyltransferase family 25 protein n=1 Tax=Vibrio harveyi group TaxID=717610 RepID=UPI002151B5C7|nr:glycosyltransferase family 25 protein [Vibrio diabolicus]MCE3220324.1 glycosyl transferase [Vibrio diabolicus]
MKIFVITTGDEYRTNKIESYFKDIDFEFVYSKPYKELLLLEREYESYSHKFRQKAIMAGEIGCFNSHMQAWDKVITLGEPAIIIEDNIEFLCDPSILLSDSVLREVNECGLVNFSNFSYNLNPGGKFKISDVKEKKPFPTICYGITPLRAEDLSYRAKKTTYALPIDKWLSIPKMCGVYGYISSIVVSKREASLKSIANQKKGKKTFNPLNGIKRISNKIKFKY